MICKIQKCESAIIAKRMCWKHYQRLSKYGDPLFVKVPRFASVEEMFKKRKIIVGRCWEWGGPVNRGGYGVANFGGASHLTHRLFFELKNKRKIRAGFVLDHLCRNTRCFKLTHLQEVTQYENVLRGATKVALNSKKTRCKAGHKIKRDRLLNRGLGERVCKKCQKRYENNHKTACVFV